MYIYIWFRFSSFFLWLTSVSREASWYKFDENRHLPKIIRIKFLSFCLFVCLFSSYFYNDIYIILLISNIRGDIRRVKCRSASPRMSSLIFFNCFPFFFFLLSHTSTFIFISFPTFYTNKNIRWNKTKQKSYKTYVICVYLFVIDNLF